MSLVATPEESKVLADIEASVASGQDPFGDEDDDTEAAAAPATDEAEDADDSSADLDDDAGLADDAPAGGADATPTEAKAEPVAEVPERDIQQFKAQVPTDYKEQRAALALEKSQALKKLLDGEIDADEYAAVETRVSEQISDLDSARIRAETLIEANAQNEAAYQARAIKHLIATTKAEVDYAADPKAQKQFDTALNTIMADPDNAGMDYAALLNQAHRVVAAVRGVQVARTVPTPPAAPPAPRRQAVTPPVTLRNLPTASTPNANGDIADQLGRLKGQDYEAAFDKLSPAQRRALLDE